VHPFGEYVAESKKYIRWKDTSYLASGSARQQAAHAAIHSLDVMKILADFDPLLVSTICTGVDIESSDLDIICHAPDLLYFSEYLRQHFGAKEGYRGHYALDGKGERVVAQFLHDGFEFEIFGTPLPISEQRAWKHFEQTIRVIEIGGDGIRHAIRKLKEGGMKTEPAIAKLLGLIGDPFEAVEQLSARSEADLQALVTAALARTDQS
jgi:hypothetical protein